MAKLKDTDIGQDDLIEYLNTSSDFAFELRCLERLSSLGFQCQHGGSYTDPVTKKTRQFDLRAEKSDESLRARCTIECKNLTSSFPLLVMCVPRPAGDSFHELLFSYDPELKRELEDDAQGPKEPFDFSHITRPVDRQKCQAVRFDSSDSAYVANARVGKSCAQVGRSREGAIIANDSEVFEKWSQTLASADELADEAAEEGEQTGEFVLSLILPILVVPDGTLWQTSYESNGRLKDPPVQTDRCSFFVGQRYGAGFIHGTQLIISHLEFVTLSGMESLLSGLFVPENAWFPADLLRGDSDSCGA